MSFQDLESGRPMGPRRGYMNGKEDPTQAVACGIFQINTAVSRFQRLVNTLGSPKDTPDLRDKLHKNRLHIGQLVKDTSAKLKQASETDHRAQVSASKKITDAKLAKDFQAVLKEFQKAQRLAAERETAYSPFVPQAVYTASEIDISAEKSPEQRALLVESRRHEVLLLDNDIAFNEAIIEEREQGIEEIQQQIGEVNEIFKDLAVLVHEQGAMIDDIGSNVENAHAATAQGRSQLAKAAKTQRSNSSLAVHQFQSYLLRSTMRLHDPLSRCMAMTIAVILIARNRSCLDKLSEVHEKYVVKSYFSKHDNLVDSMFEDFIARDILSRTCVPLQDNVKVAPKLSAFRSKLIGEGSHRRLSSSLRLKISSESIYRPPKSCEVIIVERLPSGVFADPFELQHLMHRGVFRDASVFGDTNLELPSFRSNRSLVEVHLELGSNLISEPKDDELEVHMELPLHARYQPLGHGFSRIKFVSPNLFLRCNIEGKQHDTSCLFLLDKPSTESNGHPVWEVPCGNREHTEVVSAFTFISAVVSALLIIVTSIRHSGNTSDNALKQS